MKILTLKLVGSIVYETCVTICIMLPFAQRSAGGGGRDGFLFAKLAHFSNVPKPNVWPRPRALSDYYCANRARWESCANEL
jgi:hypothetical protein